ncbi:MAG: polymer-forming cytoskeletal protein [Hyphomicrobiaceae bacterium]|nr:polymer-forming cytoskeletal protein [Hyphomicrobiaceae bacterium]
MNGRDGVLIIADGTILQGEVKNCRKLEVFGYVDGRVATDTLVVHQGGRCFGTVKAGNADVHGTLQGTIGIKELIHIHPTGDVSGTVRYGRMAMDMGGNLSAEVRNIPPQLAGDFEIAVTRGGAVRITSEDLRAVDPDDEARQLVFTMSNARGGFIAALDTPSQPLQQFTQADVDAGRIVFRHDGSGGQSAFFSVTVADHTGATSGAPQEVHVAVR